VKVLADPEVVEFIRDRGGYLFVWIDRLAFSQYVTYVEASTQSPGADHEFRRLSGGGFELLIDAGGADLPDELHLDIKGWPTKRVRAYWNGQNYLHDHPAPPGSAHAD
jgi:hypothetical protein